MIFMEASGHLVLHADDDFIGWGETGRTALRTGSGLAAISFPRCQAELFESQHLGERECIIIETQYLPARLSS